AGDGPSGVGGTGERDALSGQRPDAVGGRSHRGRGDHEAERVVHPANGGGGERRHDACPGPPRLDEARVETTAGRSRRPGLPRGARGNPPQSGRRRKPHMSLYVLDTDVLTLLRHLNANVNRQVLAHAGDVVAVAVVSAQEAISGWLNEINRQTRPDRVAHAFAEFAETVALVGEFPILPYRESTMTLFQQLRALRLNVGPNDLRIAAIALEHNAIVVTRNLRDFGRIPGVTSENWAA